MLYEQAANGQVDGIAAPVAAFLIWSVDSRIPRVYECHVSRDLTRRSGNLSEVTTVNTG
jgi:hypothetical protein